jgi:hypothetical protein
VHGPPPVTTALTALMVVVALLTVGAHPVVAPDQLALGAATASGPGPWLWWLAHASLGHLVVNLTVLWYVTPQLERLVGPLRTICAVIGGIVGGAAAHTLVHGEGVPLLGASTVVAALAAYNLVIGWGRPLEDRRGRPVLWPSHVFHAILLVELVRTLAEVATRGAPSGAAAHLGGLVAGVAVCGFLHGSWPARPASRQPLHWALPHRLPSGRAAARAGVHAPRVEVLPTGRARPTELRREDQPAVPPGPGRSRSRRARPSTTPQGRLGWRGSPAGG